MRIIFFFMPGRQAYSRLFSTQFPAFAVVVLRERSRRISSGQTLWGAKSLAAFDEGRLWKHRISRSLLGAFGIDETRKSLVDFHTGGPVSAFAFPGVLAGRAGRVSAPLVSSFTAHQESMT